MGTKRYLMALLAPGSPLLLAGRPVWGLVVHLLASAGTALCLGLSMHITGAWAGAIAVALLLVLLVARETRGPGDVRWPTLRRVGAALALATYWPLSLALAFAISPLELYRVPSTSMEPTLLPGDFLIMDSWAYTRTVPRRYDVAIFLAPDGERREYVKRVVGLPGERLSVRDHRVQLAGRPIPEPYAVVGPVDPTLYELPNVGPLVVAPGHLFMMGDNRVHSVDSRNYGPVPFPVFRGRVLWVVWPFSRWQRLAPW